MESKKVYCENCRHMKDPEYGSMYCWYKENRKYIDTYKSRRWITEQDCSILNYNNNCEWYKRSLFIPITITIIIIVLTIIKFSWRMPC